MLSRFKWLLPALTLLMAMILLSVSSREPGRASSPLAAVVQEVVGPLEYALAVSAGWVETFFSRYLWLVNVQRENERLRELVDRQARLIVQQGEHKASADRLSALLRLRQAYPHLTMQPAYVLAWDPGPWGRSVTVSAGSRDGVAVEQAVIHPTGVVGRVVEVSPNYARILLAIDFNSSIDAFVQRTRAPGLLTGQGPRPQSLKYVRKDEDLRVGDLVVTSGLDGFFPRGLALGQVSRVDRYHPDLFMAVEVEPAVDFDRLEEVMILVNQGPAIDWLEMAPRLRPFILDAEEAGRRQAESAPAAPAEAGRP